MSEHVMEGKILYQCVRCGRLFEKEKMPKVAETRCPVCGYNVIKKAKAPAAKLIKTSELGKDIVRMSV
ncbi:MAG: DNA-directed RNA polymerase subunit P [Aigarchaeota archaeon]|nr:DNA-directed RNA polymerase subunit P [Candidatus Pelearchaeum maunauluense]